MKLYRYLIIILCLFYTIMIYGCKKENTVSVSNSPYVYIKNWGADGSEITYSDLYFSLKDRYKITDKTLKVLRGKVDTDILEQPGSLKGVLLSYKTLSRYLRNLNFSEDEIQLIMENSILENPVRKQSSFCPTSIAVNKTGDIYVLNLFKHRIMKFDREGNFILEWGQEWRGIDIVYVPEDRFYAPTDIEIDSNNNIYLVDAGNHRVLKYDPDGNFSYKWILKDGTPPSEVAVDSNGNIYVLYDCKPVIKKLSSNTNLINEWNIEEKLKNDFWIFLDIAIDRNGYIYIVYATPDSSDLNDESSKKNYNTYIQKYSSSGKFISELFVIKQENISSYREGKIAITSEGNILLADSCNNRILLLDGNGNVITELGEMGFENGQFCYPLDIALDLDNNLYVCDSGNSRIQKFSPNPDFKFKKPSN